MKKMNSKRILNFSPAVYLFFFFLTLDNYVITTMKNITDDSATDNSTCRMRIHA